MSFKYRENPFKYTQEVLNGKEDINIVNELTSSSGKKSSKKGSKKSSEKSNDKNITNVKLREENIITFCKEAKSLKEIVAYFNFKDIYKFKKNYINPLLEKGTLQYTIPSQPTNRNQKYISK